MHTPYIPPVAEVHRMAPEATLLTGSPIDGQGTIENLDVIVDTGGWF